VSERLRNSVLAMLHVPVVELLISMPLTMASQSSIRRDREERAAMRVQKFVRRLAAHRELERRRMAVARFGRGATAGKVSREVLWNGATAHAGTKERMQHLKRLAQEPHMSADALLRDDTMLCACGPRPKKQVNGTRQGAYI
jgi:hypothetical protein